MEIVPYSPPPFPPQSNPEEEDASKPSGPQEEEDIKISDAPLLLSDSSSDLVGAGLCNVGSTCYLNSDLQCIMHTVPMVELLRTAYPDQTYCDSDDDVCFMCALKRLIDECTTNPGGAVPPFEFTKNLQKISSDFILREQQDAHEFLTCLYEKLDDCSRKHLKEQPSSMNTSSLIEYVYGGRSISQVQCCECHYCSKTYETMFGLSLEISEVETLLDALTSYTNVEKLEGMSECDGCKSQVSKLKQNKIDQAPLVISLHLKRFINDGEHVNKIYKFVEYPLELDVRPFISCPSDEDQTVYELYAIVVHIGSASCGHYYSCIRSSSTTWHEMNDNRVDRVSEDDALKNMAYILFYIKKGTSPWFSTLMETRSPTSVLDSTTAEEGSCSSNSMETPEKEQPGPCPVVSSEFAADCNTPTTSHIYEDSSHQKGPYYAVTNRFKRSNPDHHVIDLKDVFHDEPMEDEDDDNLTLQDNVGTKGNKKVRAQYVEPRMHACGTHMDPHLRRLMKGMDVSRRDSLKRCLPPQDNSAMKRHPRHPMTEPIRKKRSMMPSDSYPSDYERTKEAPKKSSKSLSPGSVRRGLFGDYM